MKLYYAPGRCSLAAHIALREVERGFDLEPVDLATQRTERGVDFYRINPKGDVPVLALDELGNETLTEIPAIVQYLGDLVPEKRFVPPNGTFARYHMQEWLSFIASELHRAFAVVSSAETPPDYAATVRGKIARWFNYLQDVVVDRAYLMGETFTAADAYLYVMLFWCERVHIDLALWPNLDDYEYRLSRRPSIQATIAVEGLVDRHSFRRSA